MGSCFQGWDSLGVQVFEAGIPERFKFFKLELPRRSGFKAQIPYGFRFLMLEFLTGYTSRTCTLDMG